MSARRRLVVFGLAVIWLVAAGCGDLHVHLFEKRETVSQSVAPTSQPVGPTSPATDYAAEDLITSIFRRAKETP